MDQWAPEGVDAHMAFPHHAGALEESGEFVDRGAHAARI